MKSLIPTARALTDPGEIVALATRYGHDGLGAGQYCEFYIAPANRLASAGCVSEGRLIMQAGMDEGHVTWRQMAAWEGFVKYTEANPVATDNTKEVLTMTRYGNCCNCGNTLSEEEGYHVCNECKRLLCDNCATVATICQHCADLPKK